MKLIHRLYQPLFRVWRERRHAQFVAELPVGANETLLDVGGYWWNWTAYPQTAARIDCLNPVAAPFAADAHPQHRIRALLGSGCAIPAGAGEYAVAYSNSVIEHVGSWAEQQAFAREIRRVGRAVWVQTPAYGCLIEPHFLAPAVHWLPEWCRAWVCRYLTPRGWIEGPHSPEMEELLQTTRLLTKREMRQLFPDCEIRVERLFGLWPKSYIAIRRG